MKKTIRKRSVMDNTLKLHLLGNFFMELDGKFITGFMASG